MPPDAPATTTQLGGSLLEWESRCKIDSGTFKPTRFDDSDSF